MRTQIKEGDTTQRIVREQRGGWKWQERYCIATYQARQDRLGKLRWYSIGHSVSYSEPQLRRDGLEMLHGSLHRKICNVRVEQHCATS